MTCIPSDSCEARTISSEVSDKSRLVIITFAIPWRECNASIALHQSEVNRRALFEKYRGNVPKCAVLVSNFEIHQEPKIESRQ